MTKLYHTLCVWDADQSAWFDEFGSYDFKEVKAEKVWRFNDGQKSRHLAIITHDDTADAMMAKRDALPFPK